MAPTNPMALLFAQMTLQQQATNNALHHSEPASSTRKHHKKHPKSSEAQSFQQEPGHTATQTPSCYQQHLSNHVSLMHRNLSSLQGLHHSAENHHSSIFDVDLVYRSGAKERFSFGGRVHKRSNKYARPLDPFDDFVRTIGFRLENNQACPPTLALTITTVLQNFWTYRSHPSLAAKIPSFKSIIENLNLLTRRPQTGPPRPFLSSRSIAHFFDQLHDRCIADSSSHLERTSSQTHEATYGEFLPPFLSTLFTKTSLSQDSVFLDLGSGVGQAVLQAALETNCTAYGIERESATFNLACFQHRQFESRCALYNLPHGRVILKKGDFLSSTFVRDVLGEIDVVLVNNLKLEPATDLAVQDMLGKGLKKGARVISTRPIERLRLKLKGGGRKRKVDEMMEGEQGVGFRVEACQYEAESVSWSSKAGKYYISTKL